MYLLLISRWIKAMGYKLKNNQTKTNNYHQKNKQKSKQTKNPTKPATTTHQSKLYYFSVLGHRFPTRWRDQCNCIQCFRVSPWLSLALPGISIQPKAPKSQHFLKGEEALQSQCAQQRECTIWDLLTCGYLAIHQATWTWKPSLTSCSPHQLLLQR